MPAHRKPHTRRGGGARSRKQIRQIAIGRYARRVEAGHAGLSGAVRDQDPGRLLRTAAAHPVVTLYPAPKRPQRRNQVRAARKRMERALRGGKQDVRGWT